MTRPKRKLNTGSSSGPFWPWIAGGAIVLVLLVGVGLGIALTGDKKSGDTDIAKKEGPKGNVKGGSTSGGNGGSIADALKTNGDSGKGNGGTGTTAPPPLANPKLLKFISENTVYLVWTTNGRFEMTGPENRSDLLGDFFKKLKAHDTEHGTFSQDKNPPNEFSLATYAMGTDPINLKASQIIKYNAEGGTPVVPFHYHLDKMTIVMHAQNPAKKDKSIAFNFPGFASWGQAKRPWIHVAGKTDSGIKPFYLVPLETTQPGVALINLTVGGGIQFNDATMTAKANPKTESAIKKLLKDNGLPEDIKFWAGARRDWSNWGSAHLAGKDTINFKVVMADKKAAAVYGKNNVEAYKTNVQAAIDNLFPAAQAALTAKNEWEKARTEVGEALKKGQALEGAANQHEVAVLKVFTSMGINTPRKIQNFFGRQINDPSDFTDADLNNDKFNSMFASTLKDGETRKSKFIREERTKYIVAKRAYETAKKTWQEKVKALNQKQAVLTQKNNAYATVINQLQGSPVGKEFIFDAGQIMFEKMSLDAAKKKWQTNLNKVASRDWAKEITKWDDPNHQKAEWNKFKKHPAFYLGTSSGTLIRFSK